MRSTEANSALCVCCRLLCWHKIPSDLGIKVQLIFCHNINAIYGQFPNPCASENEFLSETGSSYMPCNALSGRVCAVWEKGGTFSRYRFQFGSKRLPSTQLRSFICSQTATSCISCVRFAYKSTKLLTSGAAGLQTKLSFIGKVWD